MRQHVAFVALASAMLAVSSSAMAQVSSKADAVVGAWDIEYARGQRVENGEVTNMMAKGRIVIAISGDSLVATLDQPPRPDGSAVPRAVLGGRIVDGKATFVQKQTAQINLNGDVQSRTVMVTWSMTAAGDTLTGTVDRNMPGMEMMKVDPAPLTGTRHKN